MSNPLLPLNPAVPNETTGIVDAQSTRNAAVSAALQSMTGTSGETAASALRNAPVVLIDLTGSN